MNQGLHTVIVGASLAGVTAATTLRSLGDTGDITLLGDEAHAVFKALAKRVKRFELVGEPKRGLNNITRNCERVMVRAVC